MDQKELYGVVQRAVLTELAILGEKYVPVMSSNHHCHLSREDVDRLFGPDHELKPIKPLVQPGQFAAEEKVTMETEKGKMSLRVVGPIRKETQIELSITDAVKLGIKAPIRMSGELEGSPGCILTNGNRRVVLHRGVIIAARHLHLAPEEAAAYGVKDGDTVSLKVEGQRGCIMNNVIVRSGKAHLMEAHIDKDEANAFNLTDGQLCRVLDANGHALPCASPMVPQTLRSGDPLGLQTYHPSAPVQPSVSVAPNSAKNTMLDLSDEPRLYLGEDIVLKAARDGKKMIRYSKDAIVTPLARDAAGSRGIELAEKID